MGASELIVELVKALAWPVAAVMLVILLRRVISDRLTEVEGFGLHVRLKELGAEAERSADRTSSTAEGNESADLPEEVDGVGEDLYAEAEKDPTGSILSAYERVMEHLQHRLVEGGISLSPSTSGLQMSRLAQNRGVIDSSTADAIQSMTELRNLVAHGRKKVRPADAIEYLTAVDKVLYSLSRPARRSTTRFTVTRDGAVLDRRLAASAAFRLVAADVAHEVGVEKILDTIGPPRLARTQDLVTRPALAKLVAQDLELWHTTQLNQADYLGMVVEIDGLSRHEFTVVPDQGK